MSGRSKSPAIDVDRLRILLDGVNAFGKSEETGGYNRPAFSDADMEARRWFAREMETAGLDVRWDGAGNLFGRWGTGDGPVIMAGSHLDTVLDGGAFDGALGACLALESVRALKEAGVEPKAPVEVVVTSDEEGRFGGMLGSQAIAGAITDAWIARAADSDGVTIEEAMTAQHLHPGAICDAARAPGSIAAFLELHIEQGPVLKSEGKAVGIVESVSGICNWQVTLTGVANHSGTTPMEGRADAFAGLAEIAATIPSVIRIVGRENTRVTVGKVDIYPNHAHTIPGKAVFNIIVRDPEEAIMRSVTAALRALIKRIAENRGLAHAIDEMSWLSPVDLDAGLADRIEGAARRLKIDAMRMVSGAGHDAQTMQAVCPSALIFVPSEHGVSHAPEEHTDWADIEKGAVVYLAALRSLCMDPPSAKPVEAVAAASDAVIAAPEPELEAEAGEDVANAAGEDAASEPDGDAGPTDEAAVPAAEEPDNAATPEAEADVEDTSHASGDEDAEAPLKEPAPAEASVDEEPAAAIPGNTDGKKPKNASGKDPSASEDAESSRKSGKSAADDEDMDFDFDFNELMTDDEK